MDKKEECLTQGLIDSYLEYLAGKGRSSSSLESYQRVLSALYGYLPEGKAVGEGTGAGWKAYLLIKTLGGAGMRVQELPQLTAGAVRRGAVELEYHNCKQRRVLHLPKGLQKELLAYMGREGIKEGPVFQSPGGVPMARSSINYYISAAGREARVGEGKVNPRCLWKMYCDTCTGIRANVELWVEQEYQRVMEEEQSAIGWDG